MNTSNFPHTMPYVIQGLSADGWQDSKHGGQTIQEAEKIMREIGPQIVGHPRTRLRVVKACSVKAVQL